MNAPLDSARKAAATSANTPLTAGAARIEITPSALEGLNPFGPDFLEVNDPLYARALVFGDGATRSVIVTLDLVEVGVTTEIRQRIEDELGICADRVMLAPSHSHNAPRIGLVTPGGKARIPSPQSLVFTEQVYAAIIKAIGLAMKDMRPVTLGVAHENVDVNVCREAYVDGKWTLGHVPDGVSDKKLTVLSFTDNNDSVVAVLLNYAVHPTVMLGVRAVSADLAGAATAYVERAFGPDTIALWTSGALGDQAPKIQLGAPSDDQESDRAFALRAKDAQGFMLGATAVRLVRDSGKRIASAPVSGELREIPCPVRRLEVPPGMEQADVDTVDLTLTVFRIGPVVLAGVSGEVTVPVAAAVKQASPLANTLIVSNANARIGYLPTDESYDRKTHAAQGCPIVQGHAQKSIVEGLSALITAALDSPQG